MRALEMELARSAARRDLLQKVALSAEAKLSSEEDRAKELEARREVRGGKYDTLLYPMRSISGKGSTSGGHCDPATQNKPRAYLYSAELF